MKSLRLLCLPLFVTLTACPPAGKDTGAAADADTETDCDGSADCEGLGSGDDRCAETCERIYSEDGCNIQRPGTTSAELTDHCLIACLDAWAVAGEVGDYDPFSLTPSSTAITLDNRAQVELWNQCVEDLSCEELEEGYCAPIW